MASRETAVAALFLVFSCNMCCGDVGETVAALTRSRHNASRRRNPVKRHAFDDKPEPLSRVYVNETVWKTTGSSCISSCETLVDTDYQSCIGCHVFARCINHRIHDNNPCVKTYYQWDSYRRSCHLGTKTCKLVIGYSPCRSSPCKNGADCKSKVDGGKEVVCTCKEGYAGKNCEEASSRDFSTKTKVVAGVGVGALAAGTVVAAAYVASTGGSGAAAATTAGHTVATEGGYLMQVASGLIAALIGSRRRDDDDDDEEDDNLSATDNDSFLPNWETVTSIWSSAK